MLNFGYGCSSTISQVTRNLYTRNIPFLLTKVAIKWTSCCLDMHLISDVPENLISKDSFIPSISSMSSRFFSLNIIPFVRRLPVHIEMRWVLTPAVSLYYEEMKMIFTHAYGDWSNVDMLFCVNIVKFHKQNTTRWSEWTKEVNRVLSYGNLVSPHKNVFSVY